MVSNEEALLAHVVSQVQQNVEFLVSQNYLTRADASSFLSKLNNVSSGAPLMPTPTPFARNISAGPRPVMAKALWPYNENGTDPDDLSFATGDMIEIVEETNPDWWTGRLNGKQALFPSSYVEKVASVGPEAPAAASMPTPATGRTMPPKDKPAYKPFGAAYHGMNTPPSNSPLPGVPVNSIGLQGDVVGQEQKKSKYGKYGNQMASSAASGVGFGAGSAIGGGLVRAIF